MLNRHRHSIMPPPQQPVCTSMRYGSDVIVSIQVIVNTVQYATEGVCFELAENCLVLTHPFPGEWEKWSGKLLQIKLVVIIWIRASQSDCSRHMAPAQACDSHIYISTENGMQPIKWASYWPYNSNVGIWKALSWTKSCFLGLFYLTSLHHAFRTFFQSFKSFAKNAANSLACKRHAWSVLFYSL